MLTELIISILITISISIILFIEKIDTVIIIYVLTTTPFVFFFLFILNQIYTLSIKPFIRSSSSESLMHPDANYNPVYTPRPILPTHTTIPQRPIFIIDDV